MNAQSAVGSRIMMGRLSCGLLVVALIGAAGGLAVLFTSDSREDPMPSLAVATSRVSAQELSEAARRRVFFGHMSVGANILDGMETLYRTFSSEELQVVEFTRSSPPPDVAGGVILHTAIGENGDPVGKLRNFDEVLRSGLADQVDVAILKFCYVDVTRGTDVEALFAQYRTTLDGLQRDYPKVRFLHATVPLTVAPSGLKEKALAFLGQDDNLVRERYNALLRAAYPPDRVFDIAAVEATPPDGAAPTGAGTPALYRGYTTDGGHLNEPASALVAAAMVSLLSAKAVR
jgi:hypothetical protein